MFSSRLRPFVRTMSTTALPPSSIPLFTTVASFRQWREAARKENKSVGFVPTMGALHDGHMSLVRRSLAENDLTVMSIFVNPAQFAPHEDLATYPRTLPRDLEVLEAQSVSVTSGLSSDPTIRTPSAVFLPSVQEMYPSGIHQDPAAQKGTFIEVKGYGEQMEGQSRPTFFRGVATVVTKLFNAIEPTNAYFGQKDIQQCLVLKRLSRDLLLSHPDPEHLHIVPTARDPSDDLALSSRNAYLSLEGRQLAPTLYRALQAAEQAWNDGQQKAFCVERATDVIRSASVSEGPQLRLDYIEFNDSGSLEPLEGTRCVEPGSQPVILSGAMWVGTTRLIDNIVLGTIEQLK
ncbi:Pantoate-beta-alanine ligase [Mycena venus]|uniref:Pantoate--beta-alanine ligase n=1 Tax=Mycena venus TaxID=2733690 RepID=A0A8H6YDT7_9AGAR|nr:Pantoate-beta-alanine ligase [Mycena venus]